MALLDVIEYQSLASDSLGNVIQAGGARHIVQAPVVIGAGSLKSAAFEAQTRIVRLHTDATCRVLFGSDPTAVATTSIRMAAGQTEFFGVIPGQKVAVIASA